MSSARAVQCILLVALRKKRRQTPYWLAGNEQICTGCAGMHAIAVEARCVACDQPYCPVCVVVVSGEVFCSNCQPKERRPKLWRRVLSGKG